MPKSLWGDLSDLETVPTPKSLLEEQAAILTNTTNGVLVGEVNDSRGSGNRFSYDLDVRVPTLNNYSYTLLSIDHGVDLFPVEVHAQKISKFYTCNTQEEYESTVESVLSSSEIRKVLSRLLSQAG